MDTSGGTRVYTEMDNGSDAADEIAVSKKRPRKTYQGLCPLCGVTKEINHTANHRAVVIASQADPDTGPLFERHGVNTLDDSFHIVLKIRRPGTWWSRLLARMVRLLLPPPTRLHHPTLDPASQGPFGFGYITKLLVYSRVHNIVLKIRRPGTLWSRLLAKMVRLLLSPPTHTCIIRLSPPPRRALSVLDIQPNCQSTAACTISF